MRKPLLLVALPVLVLAGTVTQTISFDSRDLLFDRASGYDVVTLRGFPSMLETGRPMLPEAVFNVAVPAHATVTDIRVTPLDPEVLPGAYNICPAQPPVILSAPGLPDFVEPDRAVYDSDRSWPDRLVDRAPTGTKSGWRIAGFCLRPLTWNPPDGRLTLYRRMRVEVDYEENTVAPVRLTATQRAAFERDVRGLVMNPGDVARFAPPDKATDDPEVNYAIITSGALAGNWDPLVNWRTRKGYRTEVFTTEWISANHSGRDLQEKIRNFIIDLFENRGLVFVLLAGDNAVVPGRRLRAVVNTETGNIPGDVYYADLQWSYDGNNNNVFGEAGYDTVDFYYDVYVGRASVDNAAQCQTFVSKVIAYEKTPTTDYLKKMLLPYTQLWSNYSGRVCSDSIAEQTPADWIDFYIANPTSTSPMRDAINSGYHFCHATAHGDAVGLYDMNGYTVYNTSTAGGQTNSTRPVIVNSIACISGNFEYSDCLAEALMNNPGGGAVAVMMNSRYGWGTPPSMGPSERISVKFYDWYFRRDSIEIGVTHARAKDFFAYSAQSQQVWRWCSWALNLFGDPNMAMWKTDPVTLTAERPDTLETGSQTVQVTVRAEGNPVPGALVCLWKDDEVHVAGWTNWNGVASLTVNPQTSGRIQFTVTAKSAWPLEDSLVVVPGAPRPSIDYLSHFIDDAGNNVLEPGETANLLVTLRNLGNADATEVTATLRTASPLITLADSTSDFGTIAPGDTSRGDAFRLSASQSTPPGSRVEFTIVVTSAEGSWSPTFTLTIGDAPRPGALVMNHDTGYCRLTVTCLGSIGFTEPPALDAGSGFSYPKTAASQLFYSSLMLGTDVDWVADRFYSRPANSTPNADFRIVDSLRPVIPPGSGDQHYRAVISDAGHPSPKNLTVTQNSHMTAASGYDDFVVLAYDITNNGANAVTGLYAGVVADMDVGSDPATNTAGSDAGRRCAWMRQQSSANPSVGVKLLEPATAAGLGCIDHAIYVYPDSCVTDNQKFRMLNGSIVLASSNRPYDWSIIASAGPVDIPAGATARVAFAVLGGTSEADFAANADSAQSWYDQNSGVFETASPQLREPVRTECWPNPFTNSVSIACQVAVAGRVRVEVFDVGGRSVALLFDEERGPGRVVTNWQPAGLANGIYLLRVNVGETSTTGKLMLLR
ncbi:MAG: C25 family cysteine peptidase [bacterium]